MREDEWQELAELSNHEIRILLAFLGIELRFDESHSTVSCYKHRGVIISIANCNDLRHQSVPGNVSDLGLLSWRKSREYD